MIVKILTRGSEEMRIHSTGNVVRGTQEYSLEVVTRTGRRVNGWNETFKLLSEASKFANSYGWKNAE